MRVLIKNGHVIDPANQTDDVNNVFIADGNIIAIKESIDGFQADREIDARNKLVLPGLVDLSVRLREPGQEHKATIASETAAAAAAGITTLACPPDTDPVIDTPAVAKLIRQRAEFAGMSHVLTLGAATHNLDGQQLSEMAALKEIGCVGVSNGYVAIKNPQIMKRVMEYAATFDLTLFLFSEDPSLRDRGCMHEGGISTRLGLPGIPEAAETVAVARDLALVADTGVRAHFCRISTAKAAQMIARAQYDGLPVTMDVSVHQLYLTDMDVGEFDSQCHVRPPLRSQRDMQSLQQAVARGSISAICSDHQPHERDAKLRPFRESASGISGLETLLPLTLRLAEDGKLDLRDALHRVTCGPAEILGIKAGTLGQDRAADIIIVDTEQYWSVSSDTLRSLGKNSPFMGWDLKGMVEHTLINGRIVHSSSRT